MIRGPMLQPPFVPPAAQPVQHAVLEQELLARAAEEAAAARAAEEAAAAHAAEEAAAARAAAVRAARAAEAATRRAAEQAVARREANSRMSAPDDEGFQTVRPKQSVRAQAVPYHHPVSGGDTVSTVKECRWTLAEYTEGKSKHCFNPECTDKHPEGYVSGPQRRCRKAERCTIDKCNHAHPGDRFWAHVPW